ELFASLRPQIYGGSMETERLTRMIDEINKSIREEKVLRSQTEGQRAAEPSHMPTSPMKDSNIATNGRLLRKAAEVDKDSLKFHEGVASAAAATELGE